MEKIIQSFISAVRQIPAVLVSQHNGIAFLTMLPFMLSSITLAQRDVVSAFYLATSEPQSFTVLPAFVLLVMTFVVLIRGKSILTVAPFLSSIILLALALTAANESYAATGIKDKLPLVAMIGNGAG